MLKYSDSQTTPSVDNKITERNTQAPDPLYTSAKMSGSTDQNPPTAQNAVKDSKDDSKPLQPQKPAAQLEEDDEFEDFPVEGALHSIMEAGYIRVRG